ncbi:hypothetical protein FSP39_005875 [Pinctada imbricata]|uniref:Mab-21-like nucleotidyltransferase domain-containing protein n=1 Tax=Pinctada imbricata TaxID=66713 RepID=A0AA89BWX9_PINIB|nr:hypothetical protein FSP39_005875 [Pinctada imbricata]
MSLYDRLSYFLFGTEKIVDIRQKLALLRERLRNGLQDKTLRMICTGSLGEGIAYPKSDDDFMIFSDKIQVVRKCSDAVKRLHLVLSYVKDSPGYCLLLDINRSYAVDVICFASGVPIVSSFLWKQKYTTAIEGDSVHGPCCSFVLGREDFDCAFCIPCNFWPDIAYDWINRNRANRWPSHEIIQTIVRNKCHVVPVGDPDSPFHDHSWRISFSDAERTLIHSFNHVQFLTYSILRLVLIDFFHRDELRTSHFELRTLIS